MRRFAWWLLAYFGLVAVWGAYVRATGSGAGCGSHWPLCNGEVVPRSPSTATMIEFFHRLTSGLAGLLIVGLAIALWRRLGRRHPATRAGLGALLFTVTEALVGAALVKLDLVAADQSPLRAVVMAAHLINTYLLLIALTVMALRLPPAGHSAIGPRRIRWFGSGRYAIAFGAMALVGMSGAIAALGDTLFPAATLAEGLRQDASPTAHFLLRLRVIHPFLAVALGVGLLLLSQARRVAGSRAALALSILVIAQVLAGFLNLALLAPVVLQLIHLSLAYGLLVALVLLANGDGEAVA